MPQTTQNEPQTAQNSVAGRADLYRKEVEKIVREVGEHPLFELKRSCELADLSQKIEFVKDIQSIATSQIADERYLVIGADATSRSFLAVLNPKDFDEARINQLLGKYLNPVPQLEIFPLRTSDDTPFVLFVIPKQKTRRILAKATVEDSTGSKSKLLLREGDLWTKGATTAKHLATAEDWDDIYEEATEREAEARTRRRTSHYLEQALAQERLNLSASNSYIPAYMSDVEFGALVERVCADKDFAKFQVLIERLRDELVEGWYRVGAFDSATILENPAASIPSLRQRAAEYRDGIFHPAMQRLRLLGLLTVKNQGPPEFLRWVVAMLREVFELSHSMTGLRMANASGSTSRSLKDHLSQTMPALEALISLHALGAYIVRRRRWAYFRTLFDADVHRAGSRDITEQRSLSVMAFWPLQGGHGEPEALRYRAGRIELCLTEIAADLELLRLFGTERSAQRSLCEYEFCLELNSYLAVDSKRSPKSVQYVQIAYPKTDFTFWASFIAFPLDEIATLAIQIFDELELQKTDITSAILFDLRLAQFLNDGSELPTYLSFLKAVDDDHDRLMLELRRFGHELVWPKRMQERFNNLDRKSQAT